MLAFEQFALKLPISDQRIDCDLTPTYELFINRVVRGGMPTAKWMGRVRRGSGGAGEKRFCGFL